ncbi:TPA: hypothetical protein GRI81_08110 [Vibrio parahaemolyticus]|nr:hypothetical protein [Vibrio parahaemolyticus]
MNLDFSLATNVEHGYLLLPEPDKNLSDFSKVYERIQSIIYHCSMVSGEPVKHCISTPAKEASHIRAALCEFIGIEDLIQQLYPKIKKSAYGTYKSNNPTLHMIRLLRNYNIHIQNSQTAKKSIKVRTLIPESGEFDIDVMFISNLTVDGVKQLNSAKNYTDSQLEAMVNDFNFQQHEFGVITLIIKVAIDYSTHLAEVLKNNQES